jgi:sialic acid synthase SpsE/protoporphyrinogen oxidase
LVKNYYILGAGISGLVMAYELSKKGCKVYLFEKERVPGGLAKTLKWNGMPIDLGPHIFHTFNNNIEKYWKREFKGLFIEKKHWSKNFKDGVYYDYPISYESIDKLPASLRNAIRKELKCINDAERKCAKNYYEYIRALVGKTLQELFFIKYPEKIWGIPVRELDANWAPKRLEIRKNITPFHWKQWCGIGVEGSGSIINKLYKNAKKHGCKIFLGEKIKRLDTLNNSIQRIVTSKRKIDICGNDIVINTLPCTVTSDLLGSKTDLHYRGVIIIYIYAKRKVTFPKKADFVYFDDPKILFHRVSLQSRFLKNFPHDKEIYVCEITYSKGDINDRNTEKILIANVVSQLESLGFIRKKEIIGAKVKKIPEVYPSFFVGYREVLAKTMLAIESISNLYTIGSLAEYDYSDLQILFSKAIDLAEVLTDKTFRVNKMNKNAMKISSKARVDIQGSVIGEGSPVFIIAEAGLNHNGDIKLAKRLIDEAIIAEANAVKFQSYDAKNRIAPYGRTSKYAEKTLQIEETDYEMLKKCELSPKDMRKLIKYAEGRIMIFSTPFDLKSVDELEKLKIGLYKISSFDLTNIPLLKEVGRTGKPIIMSTGMASLSDVEEALQAISSVGNDRVVLLHCVSAYPCSPDNINLKAMDTLRAAFKVPVGLSDHTINDIMPIVAVSRGANVIEKHFTLDKNMEGPDHALSLTPDEFKIMVRKIHLIERALGDGIKQPLPVEFNTMLKFRKTMYAAHNIKSGKVISENDITFKGPAFGIYPKYMDIIVGQKALKEIKKDSPITWENIRNG